MWIFLCRFLFTEEIYEICDSEYDDTDAHFFCIFCEDIYHLFSGIVSDQEEYEAPESCSEPCEQEENRIIHTEHPCGDRDEMTNDWNETSDESIEFVITEKEFFCFEILCMIDEKILTIFFQKRLSYELSEYKIIDCCPK